VGALAVVVCAAVRAGIDVTERTQAVLVVQLGMLALVSVVALVKVFSHHAGPQR
jgi:hypothetical protein